MTKKPTRITNYDYFIQADTSKYRGEWIAIADQKIIAHGQDAQSVRKKAQRKHPRTKIALAKLPKEEVLVLHF